MRLALVLAGCIASSSALALVAPQDGKKDIHVRVEEYDPANRVALVLQKGSVSTITFDPGETIKRLMLGDTGGPVSSLGPDDLNQQPMVNNAPLFAKAVGRTNLVVLTSTFDGHEQHYLFDLRVIDSSKNPTADDPYDPSVTLSLTISYAQQTAQQQRTTTVQQAKMTWQEKAAAKAQAVAEARLATDPTYGTQNWQYIVQSANPNLPPVEAHDNGRITAFRYPGNMAHPTVLLVNDTRKEKPSVCLGQKPTSEELKAPTQTIDTQVYLDMILMHQTAQHWRLRDGSADVGEVWNCAWNPIGAATGTGTTSPDVYRRVITEK